mmetsp:Transcript_34104/g.74234  ORF Transcript_34104/g.74234 Transcript_34104/m.74234 type:complete len:395 (-) Transcript_34104:58-1242(-)
MTGGLSQESGASQGKMLVLDVEGKLYQWPLREAGVDITAGKLKVQFKERTKGVVLFPEKLKLIREGGLLLNPTSTLPLAPTIVKVDGQTSILVPLSLWCSKNCRKHTVKKRAAHIPGAPPRPPTPDPPPALKPDPPPAPKPVPVANSFAPPRRDRRQEDLAKEADDDDEIYPCREHDSEVSLPQGKLTRPRRHPEPALPVQESAQDLEDELAEALMNPQADVGYIAFLLEEERKAAESVEKRLQETPQLRPPQGSPRQISRRQGPEDDTRSSSSCSAPVDELYDSDDDIYPWQGANEEGDLGEVPPLPSPVRDPDRSTAMMGAAVRSQLGAPSATGPPVPAFPFASQDDSNSGSHAGSGLVDIDRSARPKLDPVVEPALGCTPTPGGIVPDSEE